VIVRDAELIVISLKEIQKEFNWNVEVKKILHLQIRFGAITLPIHAPYSSSV
jgi:hypothetical protein